MFGLRFRLECKQVQKVKNNRNFKTISGLFIVYSASIFFKQSLFYNPDALHTGKISHESSRDSGFKERSKPQSIISALHL